MQNLLKGGRITIINDKNLLVVGLLVFLKQMLKKYRRLNLWWSINFKSSGASFIHLLQKSGNFFGKAYFLGSEGTRQQRKASMGNGGSRSTVEVTIFKQFTGMRALIDSLDILEFILTLLVT